MGESHAVFSDGSGNLQSLVLVVGPYRLVVDFDGVSVNHRSCDIVLCIDCDGICRASVAVGCIEHELPYSVGG